VRLAQAEVQRAVAEVVEAAAARFGRGLDDDLVMQRALGFAVPWRQARLVVRGGDHVAVAIERAVLDA
jgi:hypothetical protein